ncbi:MAG: guanylate kinase, partial [Bacteroidota bacterium]
AGKTTLVRAMLERFDCFTFSVSATTRPPRDYEQDGVHYHFLSVARFVELKEQGQFLEWEEVYPGRYYGTLRSEVDRILNLGKYPIFDVDVKGGINIKQQYGAQALSIFIQPPHPEVLLDRLKRRGSETEETLRTRYDKAKEELSYADQFDRIIVNDILEEAIAELCQLMKSHGLTPTGQTPEVNL